MKINEGNLSQTSTDSSKRLKRFLLHGLVGALAGYFILHPLSMLIHSSCYQHESGHLNFILLSFSPEHLTMAIYFAGLGVIAGVIQGSYTHRLGTLYEHAKSLSVTDELTLLHNRRHFLEQLQKETMRAGRSRASLSMMMIDLDYFKQYNDAHGHPAGDEFLRKFARHLDGSVRETDFVARYGGEEFAVIMPDTPVKGAHHIAERLRSSTEQDFKPEQGTNLNGGVTLSIGVAEFDYCFDSPQELIASADRALYRAKHLGRNRVCVSGESCQSVQEVQT